MFRLTSLSLAVLLGACSIAGQPQVSWHSVDYPVDAGAAPRKLETWSGIGLILHYSNWSELEAKDAYAYTLTPRTPDQLCVVVMPWPHDVSVEDWDKLFRHELRHCTGQYHDTIRQGDKFVNVWQP